MDKLQKRPKIFSWNFILFASANFLLALAFYMLIPILPLFFQDHLQISESLAGLLISLYTLAALLIRPFAGILLDKYKRMSIFIISFLLFTTLFVLYPQADLLWIMALLRFVHGLVWGFLTTAGSTIAVDLIPATRRGEGLGYFGITMTLAMAIAPLAAIPLYENWNAELLFNIASVVSLFGIILSLFVKNKQSIEDPKPHDKINLIHLPALPASIAMLMITIPYGGLLTFVASFGLEIGIHTPGLFFFLLAVGVTVSRIIGGKIMDNHGPKNISVLGFILLFIGFLVLAYFTFSIAFFISAILIGLGFGIIMPIFQTITNNLASANNRGKANSTFFTAFDLGIGFGIIFSGYISEYSGYQSGYYFSALFVAVSLLFALFVCFPHYSNKFKHYKI